MFSWVLTLAFFATWQKGESSSLTLLAKFVHMKINAVVYTTCCGEVDSGLYSQTMLFSHKSYVSYNAISHPSTS